MHIFHHLALAPHGTQPTLKHTARHLVPLVPKDATLVHFTEKEGCNIDEDSILEALIAKIARLKFENEVKEAWTTNRNGIF